MRIRGVPHVSHFLFENIYAYNLDWIAKMHKYDVHEDKLSSDESNLCFRRVDS
jgi:hypothetical protein